MDATYHALFVDRWPWWVGGPAIGAYVLAFLFFQNRLLGASSTYQAVLEAFNPEKPSDVFSSAVRLPSEPGDAAPSWRVSFWLGLLGGGLLAGWLAGTWGQAALPGLGDFLRLGPAGQALVLFAGGILIGAGTRMSGGCTSGHAITGISSLQWPSLAATLVFFGVAMAVTFGLRSLLGGS